MEAVKRPLTNEQRPPSIHYQRTETKAAAIGAWEQRYYESARQSQAYDSALITPPELFFFGIRIYIPRVYLRHRSGHLTVVLSRNVK